MQQKITSTVTCSQRAAINVTSRTELKSERKDLNMDIHEYRSDTMV
jgi:hypothetical protein